MNDHLTSKRLDDSAILFFRGQLREARVRALKDAEHFDDLLFAFERLGSFVTGGAGNLGRYTRPIAAIARDGEACAELEQLLDVVRQARNDALHQGAAARHLTRNAVQVALILEDALMNGIAPRRVRHVMVPNPTCAELWQQLSLVRHQMLANSYSYLPLKVKDEKERWTLLSDADIVRFLASLDEPERRQRLAMTVADAITHGLRVEPAQLLKPDDLAEEVPGRFDGRPFVVIDGSQITGILTAFDLL